MSGGSGEVQVVSIATSAARLAGELSVPTGAPGLVLLATGSESQWHQLRTRYVASQLQQAGLATLVLDLLSIREDALERPDKANRGDVMRLAELLIGATAWLDRTPRTASLPIGYFATGSGAAAALLAAATHLGAVAAVVSCGGHLDLARRALPRVPAPTLLVVGALDFSAIEVNEEALALLGVPSRLVFIGGTARLLDAPATLAEVAHLAADWFAQHLVPTPGAVT